MKFLILYCVCAFLVNNAYSESKTSLDIKYNNFIKEGAIKPYTKRNRQLNIIKKFGSTPEHVNQYRKQAAYMAIDSDKCDYVNSSDVVGQESLEYEIICRNGAIIYLTDKDIRQYVVGSDTVVMEKEKALPRAIAKSRCEQLINNYAFDHNVLKDQLKIDRYKISTWITELGETGVTMGFSMLELQQKEAIKHSKLKEKNYVGQCFFRHNEKDLFKVIETK